MMSRHSNARGVCKVFRRNSLKSIKYAGPCEKGTFCDGDHSASARVAVSSLRRRRTSCQAPRSVVEVPMPDRGAHSPRQLLANAAIAALALVCDAGKAEGFYLRSIILSHSVTAFLNLLGFFLVRPGEFV